MRDTHEGGKGPIALSPYKDFCSLVYPETIWTQARCARRVRQRAHLVDSGEDGGRREDSGRREEECEHFLLPLSAGLPACSPCAYSLSG